MHDDLKIAVTIATHIAGDDRIAVGIQAVMQLTGVVRERTFAD